MKIVLRVFSWLLVANGLIAIGFVANTHKMLWLPEYGQGFWWAWGSAFREAPENILFLLAGGIALIILLRKKQIKSS